MTADIHALTPRQKTLRWGLWWLTLAAWSALLVSQRAPDVLDAAPEVWRFWLAKTGHVVGYAVLALLTGFLPVGRAWRLFWWLFLVFHAGLTEFLQQFVPGRHPSLRDVGLDVAGLTLGALLVWAWRRRSPE